MLVDAQIKIDKHHGIHVIKLIVDPNEQFTYNAPYSKERPSKMPAITQNYDNTTMLKPEISYQDDQWEEEAAEVLSQQSPRNIKHTIFITLKYKK